MLTIHILNSIFDTNLLLFTFVANSRPISFKLRAETYYNTWIVIHNWNKSPDKRCCPQSQAQKKERKKERKAK